MKAFLLAAALSLTFCSPVAAQQSNKRCYDRDRLVKYIQEKYQESLLFAGIGVNGRILEIHVNKKTGTWSVLATMPDGKTTCNIGSGQNWTEFNEVIGGQNS